MNCIKSKNPLRKLKSFSGGGIELIILLFVVVVACVAIIAGFNFLKSYFSDLDTESIDQDIKCITNMIDLTENSAKAVCPVTKKPYVQTREDENVVLSCPDPKDHLKLKPVFTRDAKGQWRYSIYKLNESVPAKFTAYVGDNDKYTFTLLKEEKDTVFSIRRSIKNLIASAILALFCLSATLIALLIFLTVLKDAKGGGEMLKFGIPMLVLIVVFGFLTVRFGFRDFTFRQEIRISHLNKNISIQKRYSKILRPLPPTHFSNIKAVYPFPLDGSSRHRIIFFYNDERGKLNHRQLFDVRSKDFGAFNAVYDPLFKE